MNTTREGDGEAGFPGWIVGVAIAALAVVLGYFAFGMPGMDHGASATGSSGDASAVGVDEFAARVDAAFVVNVHVPFDGEIAGTDEHIPYDEIASSPLLPEARDAPILVYCRTGAMSATAGRSLTAAGYTNVAQLDGGMDAWRRAGRALVGEE